MQPVSFLVGFLGCLSQEISWVIGKFGLGVQNKAEERLTEFWREHTAHRKHPLPTTQEMTLHMDIGRWSVLKGDWLFSLQLKMEKLYTGSKNKTGSWLWLRSRTPYCKYCMIFYNTMTVFLLKVRDRSARAKLVTNYLSSLAHKNIA